MNHVPQQALWALDALSAAGHEAWLVGGCVRDSLLGRKPNDYDLTTSASVEEMLAVFMGERVIETGLKHGTVTLLKAGMPLEITTYRSPEGVLTLREDLRHRDFTLNAIAWHPEQGLQDPFGGVEDVRNGILRAVENPDARLTEDPLRVLRAVRFASAFGLEMDARTQEAVLRHAPLLAQVSVERVAAEFVKLLLGDHVRRALMDFVDVLEVFIPGALAMKGFDQRNFHHIYDVLEHTAVAVEHMPKDPVLRLAAFFHDIGKPPSFFTDEAGVGHFYGHPAVSAKMADEALRDLKMDNFTRERVVKLVEQHDRIILPEKTAVRRALSKLTPEVFDQLILLKRADNFAQAPEFRDRQKELDELERLRDEILEDGECLSLKDLALNGRDLIALGLAPGPAVGRTLDRLLEKVISGKLPNTREALTAFVQNHPVSDGRKNGIE